MDPKIEKARLLAKEDKPAGQLRLNWLSYWTLW